MVVQTSEQSSVTLVANAKPENSELGVLEEATVLPHGWEERTVGSVCKLINGRGFKPHEWKSRGFPIIRIQNLNGSNIFNYFDGLYNKKLEVDHGQLLFAWSGSRGTSFGPHVWRGEKGLLNYHTWKVVVDSSQIQKSFFFHALKKLTKKIEADAHGASALVHTQKWQMEGFKFTAPKAQGEQAKIAEAISDADALIKNLEKLIAKKRQIKQGAMQELLHGCIRLGRFSSDGSTAKTVLGLLPLDWEVKELGELFDIGSSKRVFQRDWCSNGVPFYRAREIAAMGDKNSPDGDLFISRKMYESYKARYGVPQQGDMLVTGVGTIGKVYTVNNNEEFYFKDGNIIWFKCAGKINQGYLKQLFLSPIVQNQIADSSEGTTVGTYTISGAKKTLIPLPSLEEQGEIGDLLSVMDSEIYTLNEQLAKARELKEGMMQELLTGRIRLV